MYHGSESISFQGPKIWNILTDRLKNVNSIEAFKMQIKKWKPENCPRRLCKVYVQNVGLFKSISLEGKERKFSCEIYDFMRLWFYDFTTLCIFFLFFMFILQFFIFSTSES